MNWLSADIDWLKLANEAGVTGFVHPVELALLVKLADGRDVLEIGSYRGLSAWCMAHTAKHIVCVDTFKAWTDGQTQYAEDEPFSTLADFDRNMEGLKNVTRIPLSSEEAHALIPGSFDMVFLDAMHEYEDVKADIKRWWPRVRPGGVIAFHDYKHDNYPGVQKAVDEAFGELQDDQHTVTLRVVHKHDGAIGDIPVRSPEQMHVDGWRAYGNPVPIEGIA